VSAFAAIGLFITALGLSIVSSAVLGRRLEQLGRRLVFTEALLGIVTALGADAPEIAAAVAALQGGHQNLGLAIVFGSNVFNLAALLGLPAIVARGIGIGHRTLALNGGMSLALGAIVAGQLSGWWSATLAATMTGVVFVPFAFVSALSSDRARRWGLPDALIRVAEDAHQVAVRDEVQGSTWVDVLTLAPSSVSVVLASMWMIRAATSLGARWHVPHVVIGVLVLATLTSVPNAVSAIRLARHGRGAAVIAEAFTSNALNLIAGISVPAVVSGIGRAGSGAMFAAWWLLGMTGVTVVVAWLRRRVRRSDGVMLLAIYGAFVIAVLVLSH
jgi:cation:H+ antiporter